jgi:hypothetical protein
LKRTGNNTERHPVGRGGRTRLNLNFWFARHSGAIAQFSEPGFSKAPEFTDTMAIMHVNALSSSGIKRLPRGFQCVDKRFFWKLLDDWFNCPSQAKWHVTRKGYSAALDHHSLITLLESPIRKQAK